MQYMGVGGRRRHSKHQTVRCMLHGVPVFESKGPVPVQLYTSRVDGMFVTWHSFAARRTARQPSSSSDL